MTYLRAGAGTLLHDGGVQTLAEIIGEFVDLVLTVDGDGLARCVQDDFAVVALADMGLNLGEELGVDLAVKVVGELG
jgi:hypothetical protein